MPIEEAWRIQPTLSCCASPTQGSTADTPVVVALVGLCCKQLRDARAAPRILAQGLVVAVARCCAAWWVPALRGCPRMQQ